MKKTVQVIVGVHNNDLNAAMHIFDTPPPMPSLCCNTNAEVVLAISGGTPEEATSSLTDVHDNTLLGQHLDLDKELIIHVPSADAPLGIISDAHDSIKDKGGTDMVVNAIILDLVIG